MSDDNQNPSPDGDNQQAQPETIFSAEDVQKIMKENFHKQTHIGTIEGENKELRQKIEDLEKKVQESQSMEDFMAQMREQNYNPDQPGPTAPQVNENELLAKLEEQVFNRLTEKQQEAAYTANVEEVLSQLQEQHGPGYQDYMASKAKELGMTNEQVLQMAATAPKAMINLMSDSQKQAPAYTQSSERAPIGDSTIDVDQALSKVAANLNDGFHTPEGRAARQTWNDPDWQRSMREQIINKARKEGSQFGNRL